MGVIEIHGDSDWNTQMTKAGGKLVVADFSAVWCGPCQMIKPTYEQYSRQYSDVVFLGVDEAHNRSLVSSLGVRGFPTFHFYVGQRKVDELVGADPNALRQKIEQWRQSAFNPFASAGMTLGGSGAVAEDPREARLRRLNNMNLMPATTPAPVAAAADPYADMVCDPATGLCRKVTEPAVDSDVVEQIDMPPVNEDFLSQLKDMGFSDIRSRKALLATDSQGLELAIHWISEHQEDPDIDAPIKFVDLAAHSKTPLTPEEKAAKVAELKARIEEKRRQRAEQEKIDSVQSELKRRAMGAEMQAQREEYEAMQRRLEAEKRKREKEESQRERERLRRQIELDKLERKARGGYLGGAPLDLEALAEKQATEETSTDDHAKKSDAPTLSPEEEIVANIGKLKQYRVGNDGLTALKTLNVYVKNLLEKPDEEKFRTINLENAAFRKRVASLVGGIAFLKALGYEKNEETSSMVLDVAKRDEKLLRYAQQQLQRGITELS
ncbi:TPA: hypothetical protein N0F65_012332 [Lagenidium giganteum]|uniref:Thioredoxin n=1 Tax=Lagenidium giganteum TaxID=4803 RepID=A0AAV2YP62_9STRA|nr:TPA: hypothetical protein N0F65_012332 [Lagenidium giganteum]